MEEILICNVPWKILFACFCYLRGIYLFCLWYLLFFLLVFASTVLHDGFLSELIVPTKITGNVKGNNFLVTEIAKYLTFLSQFSSITLLFLANSSISWS